MTLSNLARQLICSLLVSFAAFAESDPIRKIAIGNQHSCALWESGKVKCWGANLQGGLGLGDRINRGNQPNQMGAKLPYVQLGKGRHALDVQVGNANTCALLDDATVKCWGQNNIGQLGLGDVRARGLVPTDMGDNLKVVNLGRDVLVEKIAMAVQHACVVTKDARVKCWGSNQLGQLGLGDRVARGNTATSMGDALPFVDLGKNAKAVDVALGPLHSCALLDTGAIKCWGQGIAVIGPTPVNQARGDQAGEMGDKIPALTMPTGKRVVSLSMKSQHGCAHFEDGTAACWGANNAGQLGLGDMRNRGEVIADDLGDKLPLVNPAPGLELKGVSAGGAFTCAWFMTGTAKCWGLNNVGQLGVGDTMNRGSQPDQVGDNLPFLDMGRLSVVKEVFAGIGHSCALLERPNQGEGVKCWGNNNVGQLGLGDVLPRGANSMGMGKALPFLEL